jgi:hypothetical protein
VVRNEAFVLRYSKGAFMNIKDCVYVSSSVVVFDITKMSAKAGIDGIHLLVLHANFKALNWLNRFSTVLITFGSVIRIE